MEYNLKRPTAPYARMNCPELWEKMHRTLKVDDRLKKLFFEKHPEYDEKEVSFGVLKCSDYDEAIAFARGLEYRNAGGIWTFTGGEAPARKIYGNRLHMN